MAKKNDLFGLLSSENQRVRNYGPHLRLGEPHHPLGDDWDVYPRMHVVQLGLVLRSGTPTNQRTASQNQFMLTYFSRRLRNGVG